MLCVFLSVYVLGVYFRVGVFAYIRLLCACVYIGFRLCIWFVSVLVCVWSRPYSHLPGQLVALRKAFAAMQLGGPWRFLPWPPGTPPGERGRLRRLGSAGYPARLGRRPSHRIPFNRSLGIFLDSSMHIRLGCICSSPSGWPIGNFCISGSGILSLVCQRTREKSREGPTMGRG